VHLCTEALSTFGAEAELYSVELACWQLQRDKEAHLIKYDNANLSNRPTQVEETCNRFS